MCEQKVKYLPHPVENIAVIGCGVVGAATGKGLCKRGHQVTFIDTKERVVRGLENEAFDARFPNNISDLHPNIIMISLPTPSLQNGAVDLSALQVGLTMVGQLIDQSIGCVAVVRSTVPPHTTNNVLIPLMERESGKRNGLDFGVCFNPEFLRAKSAVDDFDHPWVTVIGELNKESGDVLQSLYSPFGGELFRTTISVAELIKYTNNARNALLISFANEIDQLGKTLGIETAQVLEIVSHSAESAWNPRYGSVSGQPFGGTCLPKDIAGLIHAAQQAGMEPELLKAVKAVNDRMNMLVAQGKIPPAQRDGLRWRKSPKS